MLYLPKQTGNSAVDGELEKLALVTREPSPLNIYLDQQNAAPARPQDGQIAYADGTNWNPGGGGQGIYCYYGGAWNRLG